MTAALKRGLLFMMVMCSTAWVMAQEPWVDKPYTEWTSAEAFRVVTDSPWVKVSDTLSLAPHTTSDPGIGPAFTSEGALAGYTTKDAPVESSRQFDLSSATLVQWASSRTVREGMARQSILQGSMTKDQAAQLVRMSFEQYVIAVKGRVVLSMAAGFKKLPRAAFQHSAYLVRSDSKEKLYPAGIEVSPEGVAWFYFPRRLPGRSPGATKADPIEFHWRSVGSNVDFSAGAEHIKVTFDLNQMIRDGKPDL